MTRNLDPLPRQARKTDMSLVLQHNSVLCKKDRFYRYSILLSHGGFFSKGIIELFDTKTIGTITFSGILNMSCLFNSRITK